MYKGYRSEEEWDIATCLAKEFSMGQSSAEKLFDAAYDFRHAVSEVEILKAENAILKIATHYGMRLELKLDCRKVIVTMPGWVERGAFDGVLEIPVRECAQELYNEALHKVAGKMEDLILEQRVQCLEELFDSGEFDKLKELRNNVVKGK